MYLVKMRKTIIIGILFIGLFKSVLAQDAHFSQYNSSALNLNPALTGLYPADYRFSLNHRNQWSSITVPYSTLSAAFDMQLLKRKYYQDIFAGGIVVNRDIAGDSDFGTTQVNISLAYIKALNRINNHFLSAGIQVGFAQRSINYSELVFDEQYNGDLYDPYAFNGESFNKESFWYSDINTGVHWYYQYEKRSSVNAGISAFHLNTPRQSLLDDQDIRLDDKIIVYAIWHRQLSDKTDIIPSLMYSRQGKYSEFLYGGKLKYIRDNNTYFYSAVHAGLYLRHNDALILLVGLDHRRFYLGFSYDINISSLNAASNGFGAYEIALTYLLSQAKQEKIKEVPCPIF